jgi:hypothetical protein
MAGVSWQLDGKMQFRRLVERFLIRRASLRFYGSDRPSELFCAYNGVNLAGAMRPRTWVERTSFSPTEKRMSA